MRHVSQGFALPFGDVSPAISWLLDSGSYDSQLRCYNGCSPFGGGKLKPRFLAVCTKRLSKLSSIKANAPGKPPLPQVRPMATSTLLGSPTAKTNWFQTHNSHRQSRSFNSPPSPPSTTHDPA